MFVMDNLAVHHFDSGDVLEDWLAEMGIELVYAPIYPPDLNPIESCFGEVKAALNGELLSQGRIQKIFSEKVFKLIAIYENCFQY